MEHNWYSFTGGGLHTREELCTGGGWYTRISDHLFLEKYITKGILDALVYKLVCKFLLLTIVNVLAQIQQAK